MNVIEFIEEASKLTDPESAMNAARESQLRTLSDILVKKGICTREELAEAQSQNFETWLEQFKKKINR